MAKKTCQTYKCDGTTCESLCYKVNEFLILELDMIGSQFTFGKQELCIYICAHFLIYLHIFYASSVCSNFKHWLVPCKDFGLPHKSPIQKDVKSMFTFSLFQISFQYFLFRESFFYLKSSLFPYTLVGQYISPLPWDQSGSYLGLYCVRGTYSVSY